MLSLFEPQPHLVSIQTKVSSWPLMESILERSIWLCSYLVLQPKIMHNISVNTARRHVFNDRTVTNFQNCIDLLACLFAKLTFSLPVELLSNSNVFVVGTRGKRFYQGYGKFGTVLPTAHHLCEVSSNRYVARRRNDVKMGLLTHFTIRRKYST